MNEHTSPHHGQSSQRTIFEHLFDQVSDAIVITDPEGRITSVSPQIEKWFGYTGQELIGQALAVLVPNRFMAAHSFGPRAGFSESAVVPNGVDVENLGRRKDGTEFPVSVHFSFVESAEGRVVVCIFHDVSSEKMLQEPIQNGEPLFRTLFEFSPDAIIASDQKGAISEVNARVESMFGYARGEQALGELDRLIVSNIPN
jgi:PAS domain S-box-containing protein